MVDALEQPSDSEDDDRELSWFVPAIARWFERVGKLIVEGLIKAGRIFKDSHDVQALDLRDRWASWMRTSSEITNEDKWDGLTRNEAKVALGIMRSVACEVDTEGSQGYSRE